MPDQDTPRLYGLKHTNRRFDDPKVWGKNQFNSAFPAALGCYLHQRDIPANYLLILHSKLQMRTIKIEDVYKIKPNSDDVFYSFETVHAPFEKYVIGELPRTDLVIQKKSTGECLSALEIKLTALPDITTCDEDESEFGCEIVIRPDSIVYLACSLIETIGCMDVKDIFSEKIEIEDWSEKNQVLDEIPKIKNHLELLYEFAEENQSPFLMQPIWKTIGKSSTLSENCLDIFVWSDAGMTAFIRDLMSEDRITRQTRTGIWLYKMIADFIESDQFDHKLILDKLSYNTKNDKALAASGKVTKKYMSCERLENPIIKKHEIKNIILGKGQKLLSPERRLDAVIYNTPGLFDA